MNTENLATEILHEFKLQSKRYFIMLVIAILLLFASNIAWLIAWNLPSNDVAAEYDLDSADDSNLTLNDGDNNIVNNSEGEIKVDGENTRKEEDNN